MNAKFEQLERDVINLILQNYPEACAFLKGKNYIEKRDFTGKGFFSVFDKREVMAYQFEEAKLSVVGGWLNGKTLIGFVLFLENGRLFCLEGFTYGDDSWPEEIESYEFHVMRKEGEGPIVGFIPPPPRSSD